MVGRDEEFAEFVGTASASLLRTARLLTGDWHTGEDLAQAALLRVYRRWGHAEVIASPQAYTRQVMVSLLSSWRRRRWNTEYATGRLPDLPTVGDGSEQATDHVALARALGRLPAGQRVVLVLRFYEDLSVEQTAALLGCSPGTVKSRTARALQQLREADADTSIDTRRP